MDAMRDLSGDSLIGNAIVVGLCTLNQVDP
jgi:hypothetical protein